MITAAEEAVTSYTSTYGTRMGMRITCYTSYMGACADVGPWYTYMFISHLYHLIVVKSFCCVHFVEMADARCSIDVGHMWMCALSRHTINLSQ